MHATHDFRILKKMTRDENYFRRSSVETVTTSSIDNPRSRLQLKPPRSVQCTSRKYAQARSYDLFYENISLQYTFENGEKFIRTEVMLTNVRFVAHRSTNKLI